MGTKIAAIDRLADALAGSDVTFTTSTVAGRIEQLAQMVEDGDIGIGGDDKVFFIDCTEDPNDSSKFIPVMPKKDLFDYVRAHPNTQYYVALKRQNGPYLTWKMEACFIASESTDKQWGEYMYYSTLALQGTVVNGSSSYHFSGDLSASFQRNGGPDAEIVDYGSYWINFSSANIPYCRITRHPVFLCSGTLAADKDSDIFDMNLNNDAYGGSGPSWPSMLKNELNNGMPIAFLPCPASEETEQIDNNNLIYEPILGSTQIDSTPTQWAGKWLILGNTIYSRAQAPYPQMKMRVSRAGSQSWYEGDQEFSVGAKIIYLTQ